MMSSDMKPRNVSRQLLIWPGLLLMLQPACILAQVVDARAEVYPKLAESSPLITWLVFVACLAVCVGAVLFKMPKPKEKK
jgi:hypothetical protein